MFSFIINIPFTLIGLLVGFISIPKSFRWNRNPYAVVVKVRRFWWTIGDMRHARAMCIGHVVLLGPKIIDRDLEHELVHVRQYERAPLIHPILYWVEHLRKGYRNNKYEVEAYEVSGSKYKEK